MRVGKDTLNIRYATHIRGVGHDHHHQNFNVV